MCRKASKDPSVKTEIVEAVEKLFKTGQALYLVDLEADILEKYPQRCAIVFTVASCL